MKVSIITPTYNRSAILPDAVNSVLSQTFNNFELLIVDDCSTDDTTKYLDTLKDPRIKVIKHEINSGVSAARNTGIKISKGELIAYLDSDNIWHANYLEVMVSELKKDFVLAYSGQNTLLLEKGDNKNFKVLGRSVRNYKYNPVQLMQGNYIDVNCVIHRKSIFKEISMFDETLKTLEDWDLFAKIAAKYPFKIKHVDQVLGDYRFFTKETLSTASNNVWNEHVLEGFGLGKKEKDELKVLKKLPKTAKP